MKFHRLDKWENPVQQKKLVFFAQLLEEMLFDFSLDTYKPSAMNSSLLCLEALRTIDDIEKGIIQKPNLEHVLEEFVENLTHDKVAQNLISLNLQKVKSILQNKTLPSSEIKTLLELLWADLIPEKYKLMNEELLIDAIENTSDCTQIIPLTRSYVTSLKSYGYNSQFLYKTVRSFFYFENNSINDQSIHEFFSFFNGKEKNYVSIYRASKIFNEIVDSCEAFQINVTKESGAFEEILTLQKHTLRNPDEVYVIVTDIKALEYNSARQYADRRIELISTLLTLFYHKEHPSWAKDCVVIEIETMESKKVVKPINPMHKCIDLRAEKASKQLNNLIKNFSLNQSSISKFSRSAELHSQALGSDSYENQLINLWISIESLVPPKGEKAKIETIIDSLLPFLNLSYIDRILERLISDIHNWNQYGLKKALKNIPGTTIK